MRITYVCHTRFPTEKAHGKQIADVCHALANLGHEVTLLCPNIRNNTHTSGAAFYGISENFSVRYLHHFDATAQWWIPGILRFVLAMLFYRSALTAFLKANRSDLLYVRSALLLPALLQTDIPVVVELHTLPQRGHRQFVEFCKRCARIVCLTSAMRDELVEWGIDPRQITVEGDGVDFQKFADAEPRSPWPLPKGKKVIGYVGSLVTRNTIEKGVEQLIRSLVLLKEREHPVFGLIVGGPAELLHRYERLATREGLTDDDIAFHDRVPPADVPGLLKSCSILAYPAPASTHLYFLRDTSPLKLFEYLAADRPIVCADLPPLRDVVDEQSVIFCTPGDPTSMADAIEQCVQQSDTRSAKRRELAQWYDWKNRMQRILSSVTV